MPVDIFQNNTKQLPESDAQIVRVPLDELEIGGRKDHLPKADKNSDLAISHTSGAVNPGSR
jgi:hypothetical protein